MKKIFWAGAGIFLFCVIWGALHPLGARFAFGLWPVPPGTPWTYQAWSGVIPGLTIASLFASLGAAYHLHNCHQERCWRLGKHRIDGTPWCSKHMHLAKAERTQNAILEDILAQAELQTANMKAFFDSMAVKP